MNVRATVTVVVVVTVVMLMSGVSGRLEYVGGKQNWWKPGVNYSEWASHVSLYVGDWIGFRFDKFQYDVIEVNQTGYEECNNNFMITNITRGGGKDVYELKEAKTYYFICTKGFCWNGMKVAVNVTVTPPPVPSPLGNDASLGATLPLWIVLVITVLLTFSMNI